MTTPEPLATPGPPPATPGPPPATPGPPPVTTPEPAAVPAPPVGSRTAVAVALTRVAGVHQLPLHEQPDAYQALHTELQKALAAIDDA